MTRRLKPLGLTVVLLAGATAACVSKPQGVDTNPAALAQQAPEPSFDSRIERHSNEMLKAGRKIFRYDTFGSEEFWGGKLRLHEAIAGEKHGGVGPGVTARQALQLGLKVDIGALPKILVEAIRGRSVDLDKVETTLELLRVLAPRRAVLSHVEEMDRLSHDELLRLGAADGWEPAFDGLVLDVDD